MVEKLAPKLLNWASLLEEQAREQAILSSTMPFIYPHIALMPDAHWGMGATVGSVIPTTRAIIPAAVGVDIGCGMMAIKTQLTRDELSITDAEDIRHLIEGYVPLSPGKYNTSEYSSMTNTRILRLGMLAGAETANRLAPNWDMQLGSLGGGNHFIEVCYDEEGFIWLFLHSGSRGVGNKIAQHYIKLAKKENERWWIELPDPNLAYLVESENSFWDYIRDMRWAQRFAYVNREEMMDRVIDAFQEVTGTAIELKQLINCHHNYTEQEEHYGVKVWLSRKGAINAHEGVWGLIPGSMGAASYVVTGLGNKSALCSSPHGAGRQLARNKARKTLSFEDMRKHMAARGVSWRESEAFLDESPEAYKDIDVVMHDARDLVKIEHTLTQFVNVKGE